MTLKNKPQLLYDATVIRHETADYHNTAERVGVMFVDLINSIDYSFEGIADIIDASVQDALADLDLSGIGGSVDLSSYATRSWVTQQLASCLPRAEFEAMFEWAERADGTKYIHGKKGIAADWLSAPGAFNGNTGGGAGGASRLVDLTDVAVSTLRSGDAIVWNGSKWVNQKIDSGLDVSALATYLTTNGYLTSADLGDYATRSWVMGQGYLTEHQDLSGLLTRTELEAMFEWVMKADGTRYIKAKAGVAATWLSAPGEFDGTPDPIVAVNKLSQLTGDVKLSGLTAGQSLVWNGAFWVNRAINAGLDESALASYLTSHNYVTAGVLDDYVPLSAVFGGDGSFNIFGKIPKVGGDGVMEVGKYLDFHNSSDAGIKDYDARLSVESDNMFYRTGNLILDAGNYTSVLDGRYVNRAGDTMTGPLNVAHNSTFCIINSQYNSAGNYTNVIWADVANNHVVYGSPLWSKVTLETSSDHIRRQTGADFYKIWDSGNDGSGSGLDADLLDGYHNGQITAINVNYCSNENKPSSVQFMQKSSGWNGWDAPAQNWFTTIKMNHGDGDNYFHRTLSFDFFSHRIYSGCMQAGSHIGWKTLAFLDDNVASATKLQTARNIFGISFNGENDVTGRFELNGLYQSIFSIWEDGAYVGVQTWNSKPLALNPVGNNVGIGTTNPQAKLHVSGDMITNGDYFFQGYDGTLRIYSMPNPGQPAAYESETVVIQTAFDQQDPKTSYYPQSYPDRTVLALQPRGGRVGVGTAAPSCALHVIGTAFFSVGAWTNGYLSAKGNAGSSDIRLKTNLRPFALELRDIAGAPLATFDWKDGSGRDMGSIAQYWLTRCPLAVLTDPEGYYSIDYGKLATAMSISLAGVVENHEERLNRLERRITDECK